MSKPLMEIGLVLALIVKIVPSPIVVALNPVVMFKKPRRGDVTDGEADEGVDVGVTVGVDVGMPVGGGDVG